MKQEPLRNRPRTVGHLVEPGVWAARADRWLTDAALDAAV